MNGKMNFMNVFCAFGLAMLMIFGPGVQRASQASESIHKEYYENGTVKKEAQYKDGRQEGYSREYYPNGQLSFSQFVRDGKINGPVNAYYENGVLKGEASYEDNLENGLVKEYDENGVLKEETMYVRGSIIELKRFDRNGRLIFNQDSNFPLGCVVVDGPQE